MNQNVATGPVAGQEVRGGHEVLPLWRDLLSQRSLFNVLAAALAVYSLSACASSEYMGIPLRHGTAPSDLQELARRSQAGDKYAQLELGIRYEEGRGLPVNLKRAKRLYAKAAADSGGTIWIYSPPVGNGTKGRVISVNRGIKQRGLAEAKKRLASLEKVK